jgi:hypothetical protein
MNLEWGKEESHLDGSWTLVPHLYCCSASSRPRAATSIRVGSSGSYVPARGQIRGGAGVRDQGTLFFSMRGPGQRGGGCGRRGVPLLRARGDEFIGCRDRRTEMPSSLEKQRWRAVNQSAEIISRRAREHWRGVMALAARPSWWAVSLLLGLGREFFLQ